MTAVFFWGTALFTLILTNPNLRVNLVECLTINSPSFTSKLSLLRPEFPQLRPLQSQSMARSRLIIRHDTKIHRKKVSILFDSNGDGDSNIKDPLSQPVSNDIEWGLNISERTGNAAKNFIYRIAASGDGKLKRDACSSPLLPKLHAIYHASAHFEKNKLRQSLAAMFPTNVNNDNMKDINDINDMNEVNSIDGERQVVQFLRKSLENAGFRRIDERDLDLCEALNAGYLLRLAILPDVKGLDDCIGREFYPELSSQLTKGGDGYATKLRKSIYDLLPAKTNEGLMNGVKTNESNNTSNDTNGRTNSTTQSSQSHLLFDGKILIFRRGYSSETTEGLLLGQKIDYLQSSLVQRSFSKFAKSVSNVEKQIEQNVLAILSLFNELFQTTTTNILKEAPEQATQIFEKFIDKAAGKDKTNRNSTDGGKIKFTRYGGRMVRFAGSDAEDSVLRPFLVSEVPRGVIKNAVTRSSSTISDATFSDDLMIDDEIAYGDFTRVVAASDDEMWDITDENERDENSSDPSTRQSIRLLDRVSISDLVDFFSEGGRRRLIKSFTSKSKLVEPAFEEVVVIWRPLPPKNKTKLRLPSSAYKLAKSLQLDNRLPREPLPQPPVPVTPLQIRVFSRVPMANLLAILPKTKLLFRPADAVLFDLVNVVSLSVILASQKFDSAYLDILALGSISVWVVRTFVKYSNKQARYDLLVKKFLTSRMEHRNQGALEYLSTEAAEQKAIRASLLHKWLKFQQEKLVKIGGGRQLTKHQILKYGQIGVNDMIQKTIPVASEHVYVDIDVDLALDDLVELRLIRFGKDDCLMEVKSYDKAKDLLQSVWRNLFQIEI